MDRHPNSNGLELHVIHASLYRPVLFAGAEPGVVIFEIATSFALVFWRRGIRVAVFWRSRHSNPLYRTALTNGVDREGRAANDRNT